MLLDALPLDANGKVNRRALPPPGRDRPELDVPFAAPRSERETGLSAMWSDLLGGRGPIGVDDDFFEVGGDSLLAVELVARVAEATGVDIGAAEFAQRPTIAALAALIDGSPGLRAERGGDSAARILFFFHSDYGNTSVECLMLARKLGSDLRLVSMAPQGADGSPVPATIEEMAARHVGRLRALQPRGPYRLAGHCSAGVVAFELARQLRAAGDDVSTLVLIEPPALRAVRDPDGRRRQLGPALVQRAWQGAGRLLSRVRAAVGEGGLVVSGTRILRQRLSARADTRLLGGPRLRRGSGALRRPPVARTRDVRRERLTVAGSSSRPSGEKWSVSCGSAGARGPRSCLAADAGALADRLRASVTT